MTDKIKIFGFFFLMATAFVFVAGLLGGIIGYNKGKASCPQCPQITADTVAAIDSTVTGGTAVRPDADSLISVDSVPYPVPYPVYLPGDTVHDTIYVYLPVEHRLYEIPDTLKVWYSGVDPRIDSTMVYVRSTTITVDHFIAINKMPRLTAELGAGAMYLDKSVNPYLLGELRWNQPKTTFAAFGAIDQTGRWGAGLNVSYRMYLIK